MKINLGIASGLTHLHTEIPSSRGSGIKPAIAHRDFKVWTGHRRGAYSMFGITRFFPGNSVLYFFWHISARIVTRFRSQKIAGNAHKNLPKLQKNFDFKRIFLSLYTWYKVLIKIEKISRLKKINRIKILPGCRAVSKSEQLNNMHCD